MDGANMDTSIFKLVYIFLGIILGLAVLDSLFFGPKKKRIKQRNPTNTKQRSEYKNDIYSKNLTSDQIMKADINSLSGTDFEKLIAMYYRDRGYHVEIIGGSGDFEVDLIMLGKEGYKI